MRASVLQCASYQYNYTKRGQSQHPPYYTKRFQKRHPSGRNCPGAAQGLNVLIRRATSLHVIPAQAGIFIPRWGTREDENCHSELPQAARAARNRA